jgi:adhesin transport system outer membrane protein
MNNKMNKMNKIKPLNKNINGKVHGKPTLSCRCVLSMPRQLTRSLITLSLTTLALMALPSIATEVKVEQSPKRVGNTSTIAAATPSITASKRANFAQGVMSPLPRDFLTALQAVITHHPALKGQQAELNAYQSNIDSAKARRYPTLSAQANNLNNKADQGTLRLNQPLWAFGKIDTAIDEATANYTAEQWNLKQKQRQLISDTAKIYARIQGTKLRIIVVKQNITEHENLYGRISRRQQGQLASDADTRLAYSRLLQARSKLQRILGEQLVAKAELQALTQIKVVTEGAIDDSFFNLPEQAVVNKLAIKNSANVRYKRERVNVVRLNLKQEKVASLPTISFRVEHDIFDNDNDINETRAGLVFESNMEGLGFVSAGRVKGAAARVNAADEELNSALNDIRRQVNVLMINRSVQHDLVASQTDTVAAVEATMASFLRQYNSGRKSWIEVLNNQRELTELRLELVQTASDWQVLSLQLLTLIGYLDDPAGLKNYEQ